VNIFLFVSLMFSIAVLDDFLNPDIDPSTLCPFCDEPLPPTPTPKLQSLLTSAKRRGYPDPRPSNPRGLKARMAVFISACQRHRFEYNEFPKARAKGWPTDIDFKKVRERVERRKDELRRLVDGGGEGMEENMKKAREESLFWGEVKGEVEKSSRTAIENISETNKKIFTRTRKHTRIITDTFNIVKTTARYRRQVGRTTS
jgi:hypothetical protein